MSPSSPSIRLAAAIGAVAVLAACSDTATVIAPLPVDPLFTSYVALGNSITAGYQSGGINDSTQRESYAALLAAQMHTRYAYPSLVRPGCPPPIIDFSTQAREGGGSSTTCALRTPSSVTDALNNVAVPGATSFDPFSASTSASNALTTFVLGGKTQAQRAADANPTFMTAWIGNNDVLAAAVSGLLTPTPGISPGITSVATFEENITELAAQLHAIPTLKGGVMIGVIQVSSAPVLFPSAALSNPLFLAGLDQATGKTITVHPSCIGSSSLISFSIVPQIASGDHPPIIACSPGAIPNTLVGDIFVLDAAEQATLASTIQAYNAAIQSAATANGWAYWDPNPTLVQLKTSGCIATVPNLASPTPFGPCITLDGIHPSGQAHLAIADALIQVINTTYHTSLAAIPES